MYVDINPSAAAHSNDKERGRRKRENRKKAVSSVKVTCTIYMS